MFDGVIKKHLCSILKMATKCKTTKKRRRSTRKLTARARGKRAFNLGRTRFQVFVKAELKKFECKYGYPSGYPEAGEDWKGILRRAGAAYRRKYHRKR